MISSWKIRELVAAPGKLLMLLTYCAIALLSSGCITMAGGQLADIEVQPLEIPPPSVEQTVGDFSFHLDGGKMVTSNKAGREVNKIILDRWKKRGLIASETYVESSRFTGNAEYNLTLAGHQEGESSVVMQFLSGLTLFILPYWVNTQFDLVYSLEHVRSGKTFEAKASDNYRTITQLLLFPIAPFAMGGLLRTHGRLADHIYQQFTEQGAFTSASLASHPIDNPGDVQTEHQEPGDKPSAVERLRLLDQLHSEGAVTEEEYERKKRDILSDL